MREPRFSKQDLERNEDPESIAGAVGGAAGAAVIGSIGLATLGPLGALLAFLAGALGGWWAGAGFERAVEEMDREENRFRRAHEHAGARRPYEEVRHGFQLGYLAGRNVRYAGDDFANAEPDLRAAWVQAHLDDEDPVPWDDVMETARTGFDLARRKR
jgi:uncharacterized protein YcfJ